MFAQYTRRDRQLDEPRGVTCYENDDFADFRARRCRDRGTCKLRRKYLTASLRTDLTI